MLPAARTVSFRGSHIYMLNLTCFILSNIQYTGVNFYAIIFFVFFLERKRYKFDRFMIEFLCGRAVLPCWDYHVFETDMNSQAAQRLLGEMCGASVPGNSR